ncbi:MAG: hypothetical protein ACYSOT_06155 [Planctomycetota bacterium]
MVLHKKFSGVGINGNTIYGEISSVNRDGAFGQTEVIRGDQMMTLAS